MAPGAANRRSAKRRVDEPSSYCSNLALAETGNPESGGNLGDRDRGMPASSFSADNFPIGQRISLPGHFPESVVLESVRSIGSGYECRVRLPDGTPDEAILSLDEADALFGQVAEVSAMKMSRP